MLFTHSYHRGHIRGSNLFHQGWYEACEDPETGKTLPLDPCTGKLVKKPINCVVKGICHFKEAEDEKKDSSSFLALRSKAESDPESE